MWLVRNIIFYFINFVVFQFSCANFLNGFETWYSTEIFYGSTVILLVLIVVKLRNKWTGIRTLTSRIQKHNIFYTAPLSRRFLNYTFVFNGIEIGIALIFPLIYLYFDTRTWMFAVLLSAHGVESLFYLVYNTRHKNFRIGVNANAIVHNARGVYVLPFHELKSIEYKYDEYFFIYNNGETLTLPEYVVEASETANLARIITQKAQERGIFITEKLKTT